MASSTCRSLQKLSNLSSSVVSWRPTGKLQQTIASHVSRSGVTLHSGRHTTANIFPAKAGEGRFFISGTCRIPASVDSISASPLCTTLSRDGATVQTVEHLLSALEAVGVDNCGIEIVGGFEVPVLDGSAKEWVEAIHEVGLCEAKDCHGNVVEKMAPFIIEPIHVWRNNSFLAAFPSLVVQATYGIDFPQILYFAPRGGGGSCDMGQ